MRSVKDKKPLIGVNSNFEERKKAPWITVPGKYLDAIYENGGIPVVIPPFEDEKHLEFYFSFLDGFLFVGGDDYDPSLYGGHVLPNMKLAHPRRTHHDLMVMKQVLRQQKPLLAICAGVQMMNIAAGGRLIPHLETGMRHTGEFYHQINILEDSLLAGIFSKTKLVVNSYHHQAVDPNYVGQGLEIIAWAPDGIPEALSVRGKTFQLGVQWHPERIDDVQHRNLLFSAFMRAAANPVET